MNNRRHFIISMCTLFAAVSVSTIARAKSTVLRIESAAPKRAAIGFISCDSLPNGTHPSEWEVIDVSTGQSAYETLEKGRPWATDDGKPVYMYSITHANDKTGCYGGTVTTYSRWQKETGLGKMMHTQPFEAKGNIAIIYNGNDTRYYELKKDKRLITTQSNNTC